MKKLLCALICLILVIPSSLAETEPRFLTESDEAYAWLYDTSMALASRFDEALRSDTFISMYYSGDLVKAVLEPMRFQDFTQPLSVHIVRSDSSLGGEMALTLNAYLAEAQGLPESLISMVQRKVYSSAASLLTATTGADTATVALLSILTLSEAYPCPAGLEGPCFTVMYYGGLYAFLVTFCPNEYGVVIAQAGFIPSAAGDLLNLPQP